MATGTRRRKRDAANAELTGEIAKRVKHSKICSLQNNDFLGFCALREIDYYEALKLDFEHRHDAAQDDTEFALLVARKANVVTNQVRRYPSVTDTHHHNAVHDVLILIRRARAVLMDAAKRRRYDDVVHQKNENVLKIYDTYVNQFGQINADLEAALARFQGNLSAVSSEFSGVALANALENWLAAQPVAVSRPTSMNRVLVTWTPFEAEQGFTKEQVRQVVFDAFKVYGEIVNVYVCDIDNSTAIVEYALQRSQREAIERSQSRQVRFTVTEYLFKKYFNAQLRARFRDEMGKIDGQLHEMQLQLAQLRARHESDGRLAANSK